MSEQQAMRRAEIEAAAFKVLERVGYKKASMLQIAKEARASNETLYAWYGNKQSLFKSLIVANAGAVEDALKGAIPGDASNGDGLFELGKLVLGFTVTERAIIINRAAVADVQETALLAQAIEKYARQEMLRVIKAQLSALAASGGYTFDEGVDSATEVYINLLIGELQMQQSLGSISALSAQEVEQRSRRACSLFGRLYANTPSRS